MEGHRKKYSQCKLDWIINVLAMMSGFMASIFLNDHLLLPILCMKMEV